MLLDYEVKILYPGNVFYLLFLKCSNLLVVGFKLVKYLLAM